MSFIGLDAALYAGLLMVATDRQLRCDSRSEGPGMSQYEAGGLQTYLEKSLDGVIILFPASPRKT